MQRSMQEDEQRAENHERSRLVRHADRGLDMGQECRDPKGILQQDQARQDSAPAVKSRQVLVAPNPYEEGDY
jgi:hypothetical protein